MNILAHPMHVREDAIDLLVDGRSRSYVARVMEVTWPTIDKWLTEYKLAAAEIDHYLEQRRNAP